MNPKRQTDKIQLLQMLCFAALLAFVGTGCDLDVDGDTDPEADETDTSYVEDTTYIDTGMDTYYVDTDSQFDCSQYYHCMAMCSPWEVDTEEIDSGNPSASLPHPYGCEENCQRTWPQCVTPEPPVDCKEQYYNCIDSCTWNTADWGFNCADANDPNVNCVDTDTATDPEYDCFDQCEWELAMCEVPPPPATCDMELTHCLDSCYQPMICTSLNAEGDDTECGTMDSDDIVECEDKCFFEWEQCMEPPVNDCEEKYNYCTSSCAWDDKFCHDHCYEDYYYCVAPVEDNCENTYDNCLDECAWDDKFCHDHCYEDYYYCVEGNEKPKCEVFCDGDQCWQECCVEHCDHYECWSECSIEPITPECNTICYDDMDGGCWTECCVETAYGIECWQVDPTPPVCHTECTDSAGDDCITICCDSTDNDIQNCWEEPSDTDCTVGWNENGYYETCEGVDSDSDSVPDLPILIVE